MNWNNLNEATQLSEIKDLSQKNPVVLFKHSTRCVISSMAKNRLERSWDESEMNDVLPFYLDLIGYRGISGQIESEFGIAHQSPQLLVIFEGKCVYNESHNGINYTELKDELRSLTSNN